MPLARRHLGALRLPRVEAVAFGAAHARPLHLRQLDVDLHVRHRQAVEADRDELGLETVALLAEERQLLDADVPRRRMNEQAGPAGDVLPRHVLDVAFQRVGIRHAGLGVGLERQRQLARRGQRRLVRLHLPLRLAGFLVRVADKRPPFGWELVGDRGGRGVDRRSCQRPGHRALPHRRAEQVARRDHPVQRIAGDAGVAGQRQVDAEVRPPVRRDEKRAGDGLLVLVVAALEAILGSLVLRRRLHPIALENGADDVAAERALERNGERPVGSAPAIDLHAALVDDLVAAVADADVHR